MSIVLTWNKEDTDDVLQSYEVYRSTDKTSIAVAGNLIATIVDKTQVQYADATALVNTPYWYVIRSKTIYGDIDSTAICLVDCTNPGYGSVAPTVGDYGDGFVETYFNELDFSAAANKILMDQFHKTYTDTNWDFTFTPQIGAPFAALGGYCVNKFWKDGKPIFAPNHPQQGPTGSVTVQAFGDNIIAPLIANKPHVEINGVMYEFNIMTQADFLKYIACGSYRLTGNTTNHWTDRVVPKTYLQVSIGGVTARSLHRTDGGTTYGSQIEANGALTVQVNTAQLGSWSDGISWYFTPVMS